MNEYRQDKNNKNYGKPNSRMILMCVGITVLLIIFFSQVTKNLNSALQQEITYDQFLRMVEEDLVDTVYIKQEKLEITPKTTTAAGYEVMTFYTGTLDDDDLIKRLYDSGVSFRGEIVDTGTTIFDIILAYGLPFIII